MLTVVVEGNAVYVPEAGDAAGEQGEDGRPKDAS